MNQSTATTSNYHKTSKNHLKINASVKSTARHTTDATIKRVLQKAS
jgi:hypothetical protein